MTNLFRVGGIYRQNDGELRRLAESPWSENGVWRGCVEAKMIDAKGHDDGARRLSDGKYPPHEGNPHHPPHLIPEEVNEQGKPVAAVAKDPSAKRDEDSKWQARQGRVEHTPFDPFGKDWYVETSEGGEWEIKRPEEHPLQRQHDGRPKGFAGLVW